MGGQIGEAILERGVNLERENKPIGMEGSTVVDEVCGVRKQKLRKFWNEWHFHWVKVKCADYLFQVVGSWVISILCVLILITRKFKRTRIIKHAIDEMKAWLMLIVKNLPE